MNGLINYILQGILRLNFCCRCFLFSLEDTREMYFKGRKTRYMYRSGIQPDHNRSIIIFDLKKLDIMLLFMIS
ncbi:hypothetical protein JHK84_051459 [Glycine max]|nr:hypothetical protein JHK85_052289 [Glycine max]KAG5095871.1 hypothetical protein JHK84_051459 [Glycine max]